LVDEGFREFVQTRYGEMLRVAYLLTGSEHEAEDLLQGALLRVMRRWHRIDDPVPYLRRTMINLHVSRWRRQRAREFVTAVVPDRPERDPADQVSERQSLLSALRALPPRTRAVIVLRYWVDLSEAQTAALLGCSVGSVKSNASRGLSRLRTALPAASPPDRLGSAPDRLGSAHGRSL
jgi:RNA polymerase sigma-70 factor (sigma-E family)